MASEAFNGTALLDELEAHGCSVSRELFSLSPIQGMGNGLLATQDIPSGTPLFSIPPSYLLSEYTSDLRSHLSSEDWETLEGGWTRLILCMMYEDARPDSPWRAYLDNSPRSFTTPMWWPESELEVLKGTDIEGRIGRKSADEDFEQRVKPLAAKYPALFPNCTAEDYHRQGSRVLSRSFTVARSVVDPEYESDGESDDELDEEEGVPVMVPLADMLNAAHGLDNARLFSPDEEAGDDAGDETIAEVDEDEDNAEEGDAAADNGGATADNEADEDDGEAADADVSMRSAKGQGNYSMVTTKDIVKGEQIYNTYASPCNSELLRKYGHVDVLPLPEGLLPANLHPELGGNAFDEVALAGDLVLRSIGAHLRTPVTFDDAGRPSPSKFAERLDVWLDAQDDAFALPLDGELPEELIGYIRLFLEDEAWERARTKGKMPKPTPTTNALAVIEHALAARLALYADPKLDSDVAALKESEQGSNAYNAAAVRLGEKRCILQAQEKVAALKKELKKRRIEERKNEREKKRRR